MVLPTITFVGERLEKARRLPDRRIEVLVKWRGMEPDLNTWEPLETIPERLWESRPRSERLRELLEKGPGKHTLATIIPHYESDIFAIEKVMFMLMELPSEKTFVFIKWEHYPASEASWEPISNITDYSAVFTDIRDARHRSLTFFNNSQGLGTEFRPVAARWNSLPHQNGVSFQPATPCPVEAYGMQGNRTSLPSPSSQNAGGGSITSRDTVSTSLIHMAHPVSTPGEKGSSHSATRALLSVNLDGEDDDDDALLISSLSQQPGASSVRRLPPAGSKDRHTLASATVEDDDELWTVGGLGRRRKRLTVADDLSPSPSPAPKQSIQASVHQDTVAKIGAERNNASPAEETLPSNISHSAIVGPRDTPQSLTIMKSTPTFNGSTQLPDTRLPEPPKKRRLTQSLCTGQQSTVPLSNKGGDTLGPSSVLGSSTVISSLLEPAQESGVQSPHVSITDVIGPALALGDPYTLEVVKRLLRAFQKQKPFWVEDPSTTSAYCRMLSQIQQLVAAVEKSVPTSTFSKKGEPNFRRHGEADSARSIVQASAPLSSKEAKKKLIPASDNRTLQGGGSSTTISLLPRESREALTAPSASTRKRDSSDGSRSSSASTMRNAQVLSPRIPKLPQSSPTTAGTTESATGTLEGQGSVAPITEVSSSGPSTNDTGAGTDLSLVSHLQNELLEVRQRLEHELKLQAEAQSTIQSKLEQLVAAAEQQRLVHESDGRPTRPDPRVVDSSCSFTRLKEPQARDMGSEGVSSSFAYSSSSHKEGGLSLNGTTPSAGPCSHGGKTHFLASASPPRDDAHQGLISSRALSSRPEQGDYAPPHQQRSALSRACEGGRSGIPLQGHGHQNYYSPFVPMISSTCLGPSPNASYVPVGGRRPSSVSSTSSESVYQAALAAAATAFNQPYLPPINLPRSLPLPASHRYIGVQHNLPLSAPSPSPQPLSSSPSSGAGGGTYYSDLRSSDASHRHMSSSLGGVGSVVDPEMTRSRYVMQQESPPLTASCLPRDTFHSTSRPHDTMPQGRRPTPSSSSSTFLHTQLRVSRDGDHGGAALTMPSQPLTTTSHTAGLNRDTDGGLFSSGTGGQGGGGGGPLRRHATVLLPQKLVSGSKASQGISSSFSSILHSHSNDPRCATAPPAVSHPPSHQVVPSSRSHGPVEASSRSPTTELAKAPSHCNTTSAIPTASTFGRSGASSYRNGRSLSSSLTAAPKYSTAGPDISIALPHGKTFSDPRCGPPRPAVLPPLATSQRQTLHSASSNIGAASEPAVSDAFTSNTLTLGQQQSTRTRHLNYVRTTPHVRPFSNVERQLQPPPPLAMVPSSSTSSASTTLPLPDATDSVHPSETPQRDVTLTGPSVTSIKPSQPSTQQQHGNAQWKDSGTGGSELSLSETSETEARASGVHTKSPVSAILQKVEKDIAEPKRALTTMHCGGLTISEPELWTRLRLQSARVALGIATEIRQPPTSASPTDDEEENVLRCYCSHLQEGNLFLDKLVVDIKRYAPRIFNDGLTCQMCSVREHSLCSLVWITSYTGDIATAIDTFVKDFYCLPCRLILLARDTQEEIVTIYVERGSTTGGDPFASIKAILALAITPPPLPSSSVPPSSQQPQQEVKTVTLSFRLSSAESRALSTGEYNLQVRGTELTPSGYRQSGFPRQVAFRLNTTSGDPLLLLKAPGAHRKRKEEPRTIPKTELDFRKRNRLLLECTYQLPSSHYLFSAVLVRSTSASSYLETVQKTSWLPTSLCREVCRAMIQEASAAINSGDDVLVERGDVNVTSLRCPSTLMRIELPGRGLHCRHLQCFDVSFYIPSQTRIGSHKNRWKCPVCYKHCYPHEIILDRFLMEILEHTTESDQTVNLVVNDTGITWHVTQKDDLSEFLEPSTGQTPENETTDVSTIQGAKKLDSLKVNETDELSSPSTSAPSVAVRAHPHSVNQRTAFTSETAIIDLD